MTATTITTEQPQPEACEADVPELDDGVDGQVPPPPPPPLPPPPALPLPVAPDRRFSIADEDDMQDAGEQDVDESSREAASAASILASVAERGAVAEMAAAAAATLDRRFSIDEDEDEIWRRGCGSGGKAAALAAGAAASKLAASREAAGPTGSHDRAALLGADDGRSRLLRRLGIAATALLGALAVLVGVARLALVFL